MGGKQQIFSRFSQQFRPFCQNIDTVGVHDQRRFAAGQQILHQLTAFQPGAQTASHQNSRSLLAPLGQIFIPDALALRTLLQTHHHRFGHRSGGNGQNAFGHGQAQKSHAAAQRPLGG